MPEASQMNGALRQLSEAEVDGARYARVVARTQWIEPGDDLASVVRQSLGPHLVPGDIVVVSEKALVISAGFGVPAETISVSALARRLAAWVRPTQGSRGLSIPEKMQQVLNEVGRARIVLAAALAGLTRPFGLRGVFYLVAGRAARAMDGMRPPFEHLLLPSLPPRLAGQLARELADRLGTPVAIVDINDRGGSVRAISHPVINKRRLFRLLADNPLGQRDTRTPIGYLRRLS